MCPRAFARGLCSLGSASPPVRVHVCVRAPCGLRCDWSAHERLCSEHSVCCSGGVIVSLGFTLRVHLWGWTSVGFAHAVCCFSDGRVEAPLPQLTGGLGSEPCPPAGAGWALRTACGCVAACSPHLPGPSEFVGQVRFFVHKLLQTRAGLPHADLLPSTAVAVTGRPEGPVRPLPCHLEPRCVQTLAPSPHTQGRLVQGPRRAGAGACTPGGEAAGACLPRPWRRTVPSWWLRLWRSDTSRGEAVRSPGSCPWPAGVSTSPAACRSRPGLCALLAESGLGPGVELLFGRFCLCLLRL